MTGKRMATLERDLERLGSDPNNERSVSDACAETSSELRERIAADGGIEGCLRRLHEAWDRRAGESSPLELVMRDAMRDHMLTFRERIVLVFLMDRANERIARPRPWGFSARPIAEAISLQLGIDEDDVPTIMAALVTRGWLPKPAVTRRALKPSLRFMIMDRDGFRCVYCGCSGSDSALHVDHVTPVSKGGSDDPANLVTACEECNIGKSARLLKTPLRLVPREAK